MPYQLVYSGVSNGRYLASSRFICGGCLFAVTQQALFLPTPIAFGAIGAFVVVLFTLGDADLHFHLAAMVEIHHQRHQRHSFALGF